jgi:hypothetical protein
MLLKFLLVPAVVALVFGVVRILLMFRARCMRALAARRGFQYIGPSACKWGFPSLPRIKPPVPVPFLLAWFPASEMRQVWNVIEGQQAGVSVLIFDCAIGEGKGTHYRTFIACKSKQHSFGTDSSRNRVMHSGGWTALYHVPFLDTPWPWTLGIQRLDDYVNKLGVGSLCESSYG